MELWLFLAITITCWGLAPILEKSGLKGVDAFSAVFVRSAVVFAVLCVAAAASGRFRVLAKVPLKSLGLFALSGILAGLVGMWSYFKVLKIGPASKVVPLSAVYPLVTAILSVLLLREHVTLVRIVGTALIILGVILVK
jgi:transporter family protein